MNDPVALKHTTSDPENNRLFMRGALIWLVLFFVAFISFTLPNNNTISRWDIVTNIPYLLLDLVDPLPEENPHPAGWRYFPQRIPLMGIAFIILAGAWGLGQIITRLIRIPFAPFTVERTVFAYGVGLSCVSLLTLGGGLLGILSQTLGFTVLGMGALLGGVSAWTESKKQTDSARLFNQSLPESDSDETMIRVACCLLIAPFVLSMFLGSMLPSVDFDVLEYHFGGPKEYYQQGYIGFLPHNVYTSFPFLTEMLTLLAMTLKADWYFGAQAGKLVLMSFSVFTALGVFAAARRWFGSEAGWLAATIYLTTPWVYRISIIALTEGALSFYLMASLLALILTIQILKSFRLSSTEGLPNIDSKDTVPQKNRLRSLYGFTCLTGLLCGSAMACKYPGVLSAVIPLGLALLGFSWFLLKYNRQQRISISLKLAVIFTLGTILAIGPWLLKNLFETGNPVYPLLYSVFGGVDLNEQLNIKWKGGHSPDTYNVELFV